MVYAKVASRSSAPLAHGGRPQGIRKEARPLRRSARLQQRRTSQQVDELLTAQDRSVLDVQLQPLSITRPTSQKRKRSRETHTSDQPTQKRQRQASTTAEEARAESASDSSHDPIDYWRRHMQWPQTFFESEGDMAHLLVKNIKLIAPLRRKASSSTITSNSAAQSDHNSREGESASYKDGRYESILEANNSFLREDDIGDKEEMRALCVDLMETEQSVPQDSLFNDNIFGATCRAIRGTNETRLVRDITVLIVPSAEVLAIRGLLPSENLVEAVNQGWSNAIPIASPRPQPDYSVGFKRGAFQADELERLEPFIGSAWDRSYFKGTYFMYFPFLTCEVKCGAEALDVADRQNAHSMTLAVRAVVELFRLVKREKEINCKILAFSVSHDDSSVRIYGHYPVLQGSETKYYRYEVDRFDFTGRGGKEKWTAYKFTKNVYEKWVPAHLEHIRSAIKDIPLHFNPSSKSGSQSSNQTTLSQSELPVARQDSAFSNAHVGHMTPETSVSSSARKQKR